VTVFQTSALLISFGRLAPLFDHSKTENVVVRKDDCGDAECLRLENCRLDRGSPYCYKASKNAHAMLDPAWIAGRNAYHRRTTLKWLFLLRNDPVSPACIALDKEEALRILEAGEPIGLKKSLSPGKAQPYFNPHLLVGTPERLDLERSFFRRLLEQTSVYLFNSGVAGADKLKEILFPGK